MLQLLAVDPHELEPAVLDGLVRYLQSIRSAQLSEPPRVTLRKWCEGQRYEVSCYFRTWTGGWLCGMTIGKDFKTGVGSTKREAEDVASKRYLEEGVVIHQSERSSEPPTPPAVHEFVPGSPGSESRSDCSAAPSSPPPSPEEGLFSPHGVTPPPSPTDCCSPAPSTPGDDRPFENTRLLYLTNLAAPDDDDLAQRLSVFGPLRALFRDSSWRMVMVQYRYAEDTDRALANAEQLLPYWQLSLGTGAPVDDEGDSAWFEV